MTAPSTHVPQALADEIASIPTPATNTQETAAVLRDVQAEQKAHPDLYDDYNVSAVASSLYLVEHPEVRVSTEADYPGWKPGER